MKLGCSPEHFTTTTSASGTHLACQKHIPVAISSGPHQHCDFVCMGVVRPTWNKFPTFLSGWWLCFPLQKISSFNWDSHSWPDIELPVYHTTCQPPISYLPFSTLTPLQRGRVLLPWECWIFFLWRWSKRLPANFRRRRRLKRRRMLSPQHLATGKAAAGQGASFKRPLFSHQLMAHVHAEALQRNLEAPAFSTWDHPLFRAVGKSQLLLHGSPLVIQGPLCQKKRLHQPDPPGILTNHDLIQINL